MVSKHVGPPGPPLPSRRPGHGYQLGDAAAAVSTKPREQALRCLASASVFRARVLARAGVFPFVRVAPGGRSSRSSSAYGHRLGVGVGYMRLRDESRNAKSRGDEEACVALAAAGDACARLASRCLSEPGCFGASSGSCRATLSSAVTGQSAKASLRPEFLAVALRGVAEDALSAVVAPTVDAVCASLRKPESTEGDSARACAAIATLLQAGGKVRAGEAIVAHAMFAAPPLETPAADEASNPFAGLGADGAPGGLSGLLQAMAAAARQNGARAFETATALGLIFRLGGCDPSDQAVRDEIRDLARARPTRAIIENKQREVGSRVGVARDGVGNLIDALVKNGAPSREATMHWLAALLNRSKDAAAMQADRATAGPRQRARRTPLRRAKERARGLLLGRLAKPPLRASSFFPRA